MPSTGDGPHRDGGDGRLSRREFLLAAAVAPALIGLTQKSGAPIAGGFVDDDSAIGHALRDGTLVSRAREQRRVPVAIVGGGIGGLSAGWRLDARGMRDWLLLELANTTGGNSRFGSNDAGRFPWGAHYLPVPATEAVHVRALMRELGVLGANGQWDERVLCHSPQERLWQHGRFHDGLDPTDALPRAERAQFARFDAMVADWRSSQAFSVPSALGQERLQREELSRGVAATIRALDGRTADSWMREQGFTSPALRWWVEYGTRDDYGSSLTQASAWAAVHYFAARGADAIGADSIGADSIGSDAKGSESELGPLTWPEGNGWIAQQLAARAGDRVVTNAPAVSISRVGTRWLIRTPKLDVSCEAIIWAAPLFVLPKVLPSVQIPVPIDYASWVVANITLRRPPQERGAPPAWDSVIYGSPSLGYVDAGHQSLATRGPRRVWTWYHAVADRSGPEGRRWLQQQPWTAWRDRIVNDLTRAHSDIAECVERIDVMRWGHAMARPLPGVLDRVARLQAWSPAPRVFIAHADMSSLSLFEEAQWHGIRAADGAVRTLDIG